MRRRELISLLLKLAGMSHHLQKEYSRKSELISDKILLKSAALRGLTNCVKKEYGFSRRETRVMQR
jgi:hypothetical protein